MITAGLLGGFCEIIQRFRNDVAIESIKIDHVHLRSWIPESAADAFAFGGSRDRGSVERDLLIAPGPAQRFIALVVGLQPILECPLEIRAEVAQLLLVGPEWVHPSVAMAESWYPKIWLP